MLFIAVRIVWLAAAVAACAPVERNTVVVARVQADTVGSWPAATPEMVRVDPEEMAERAVIGGLVGGMLGASVGAIASFNPAFGAMIGGPAGAVLGSAVGIATTPPMPGYAPIAAPARPVIPGFYDNWPPGFYSPPIGIQVPPPPPAWSPAFDAKIVSDGEYPPDGGAAAAETPVRAPL